MAFDNSRNITSNIRLWWPPKSLKPLVEDITLLLDLMEHLMEFFLESRSLRLCLLLQAQHDTHATTIRRHATVAVTAPSTRVSEAHAYGSMVLSGSARECYQPLTKILNYEGLESKYVLSAAQVGRQSKFLIDE